MKIGLMVFLANERENNRKRPYESIRSIAQQAEADGFDSLWLPDHFFIVILVSRRVEFGNAGPCWQPWRKPHIAWN